ncbi:MAG: UDP-N-acetylglucosamine 2-epimerase (non-hydrolyzing) [Ignavibacterium sp.]|jgi:UDP-N-acetylglucosamine 2-epimerase (non-hydrolysing)|nr:UDP-N-acetylglucosamine 2-epimerase (non-hydrolyzing) [Ignavibacterium sp.]
MKIISVVGARPNFMKVAPFIFEINRYNLESLKTNREQIFHLLVHTGQHYDDLMSQKFFNDLNIPEADINLGIGSGSHAEQVGNSMIELEKVFQKEKPDWVIIYGDVNATLAASITAKKLLIKVCHIEAGLRSGDLKMPEEINRLVTDRLADLLLTPDLLSVENLKKEGIPDSSIRFVGNIMIDTLENNRAKSDELDVKQIVKSNIISNLKEVSITQDNYAVITLHRPSNVDDKEILTSLVGFISKEISDVLPVIWAIHPRTEKQLKLFNLWNKLIQVPDIFLVNPLGYHDMLKLNKHAKIMLTDSGGLQEECTVLGTPCLTLRWNTERPVTLREYGGASVLVGNDIDRIREEFFRTLKESRRPERPALWDGRTAGRCLEEILKYC